MPTSVPCSSQCFSPHPLPSSSPDPRFHCFCPSCSFMYNPAILAMLSLCLWVSGFPGRILAPFLFFSCLALLQLSLPGSDWTLLYTPGYALPHIYNKPSPLPIPKSSHVLILFRVHTSIDTHRHACAHRINRWMWWNSKSRYDHLWPSFLRSSQVTLNKKENSRKLILN